MSNLITPIYVEDADLANYPSCDQDTLAHPKSKIVVGDLHGNALKLLHILVTHGFVSMPEKQYHLFKNLYNIGILNESGLRTLREIIDNLNINPHAKEAQLLLMGDVLADRGSNDFYTLYLLKRLCKDIKLEILLSNHDAEFIECMENGKPFDKTAMSREYTRSAHNLQKMIDEGLISYFEVRSLYREVYKPALKAVSYAYYKFDDETSHFSFFSHAPAGLNTFQAMAKAMGVEFSPNGKCLFAESIDMINASFQKHVNADTISQLINQDKASKDRYKTLDGDWEYDIEKYPFTSLIWNRDQTYLDRPSEITLKKGKVSQKVLLMFFNGHDSVGVDDEHIVTLDNEFGKVPYATAGAYYGFCFQDHEKDVPPSSMLTDKTSEKAKEWMKQKFDEMDCTSPPRSQASTSSQSCYTSPQSCDPSPKKLKLGKNEQRNVVLPQFDFTTSAAMLKQGEQENVAMNSGSGHKRPRRLTFDQ